MNFDTQVDILLEGFKDKLLPITPKELGLIQNSCQGEGKLINPYTVKLEIYSDGNRSNDYEEKMHTKHATYQAKRHGHRILQFKGVREYVTYVSHLKNGLWRYIERGNDMYAKAAEIIQYFKDLSEYPQDEKLHRLDGPAVIVRDCSYGTGNDEQFWIDGKEIPKTQYWEHPLVRAYAAGGQDAVNAMQGILDI